MTGKISKIMDAKVYGFITGADRREYFFHKDDCISNWSEIELGSLVEFETVETNKGARASGVKFVGE